MMKKRSVILCSILCLLMLFPIAACSQMDDIIDNTPILADDEGWDLPSNEGVRNALLNAEQLVNLRYAPIKDLYKSREGVIASGSNVRGMVYSSTRYEDLFCPNNVSLWTFMSALNNPSSYLYTVDIKKPPYSIKGSVGPLYGQVCTQFVQYALGIKHNFQIYQMTVWDGFDRLPHQHIDNLRLGDVLTSEKMGHTRMVTGIHREGGHVVEVAISESESPVAKREVYPAHVIASSFGGDGYQIYRYRYIENTPHEPSPFVSVGGEPLVDVDQLLVREVIPRRGDKANWRKDEEVVIDVVSQGDYADYKLYNGDALVQQSPIPHDQVINLGVMPCGDYKLCLSRDSVDSRFAYWIVADYSISAEYMGNRTVKVSFSSQNATPVWVTWRRPALLDAVNNNMPLWTTKITKEDCEHGFVMTTLDKYIANRWGLGEWDFKVAFETKYGIISSDSQTVNIY